MTQTISTLRLVVIALIVGLVSFVGIMLWLTTNTPPPPNPDAATYWTILAGLAAGEFISSSGPQSSEALSGSRRRSDRAARANPHSRGCTSM